MGETVPSGSNGAPGSRRKRPVAKIDDAPPRIIRDPSSTFLKITKTPFNSSRKLGPGAQYFRRKRAIGG